jgi:hypothetical protein
MQLANLLIARLSLVLATGSQTGEKLPAQSLLAPNTSEYVHAMAETT